jgi:hypothetical protein
MAEIKLDSEHLETPLMLSDAESGDTGEPIVLSDEDLGWAAGGLLTRKVNEYEGQHR